MFLPAGGGFNSAQIMKWTITYGQRAYIGLLKTEKNVGAPQDCIGAIIYLLCTYYGCKNELSL